MSVKKNSSLLLFALIFLLPIIVFSVYEIGTLRDNEAVIESIYNNQLDAILYSINQYSDDVLSDWADNLSGIPAGNKTALVNEVQKLPSLYAFTRYNSDLEPIFIYPDSDTISIVAGETSRLLAQQDSILKKLETYLRGNYRKITPLGSDNTTFQQVIYALEDGDMTYYDVFLLKPQNFIAEVLDPKIQEIARNKFYIGALNNSNGQIVYNSDKQYRGIESQFTRALWFLPGYDLSIELKDTTIGTLIRDRSTKDLMVILIVDLVLITGLIFVYRNVRRETKLSRLKTDFVSNVSHEIRTPLALISMYIESLEMGRVKNKEKTHEYYRIILQETHRLSAIINKILNFSQIENDKRRYTLAPGNINDVVAGAYGTFKFNLEQKEFDFQILTDSELPEISMDREAVTDALVNLIDNASKYSDGNKSITVSTGQKANWVYVEVADKGIGISPEDQQFIFDKFFRVTEKNLALKARGSGLGLTIVKHIMDAHNGKIEVESAKNAGSVFRLLFPKE
jgi:two-component system phosphate regulon sensor histidine kinase PhoR